MVTKFIFSIVLTLLQGNPQQNFMINTNGYYYATYLSNLKENDFFEDTNIVFVKFDEDGYCNVFEIPVQKGNSLQEEILDIKERVYTKTPRNSGIYTINADKIIIEYSIFNNANHLFGRYIKIRYEGTIMDNKILLKTHRGHELELEFIQDDNVKFKN